MGARGESGGKNEHCPAILKEWRNRQSRNRIRRCEVSLGDTMKTARLFQVLMFAGTLVAAASGSDDSLPPLQSTASQYIIAETSTAPAHAGNDGSGSQPSPALDRRDGIFYPGDTEQPKPLLRKLFLKHCLRSKRYFYQPLPRKSTQRLGMAGANGCHRSVDRQRYPYRHCF
jgi:hypothetical protein